MIRWGIIGAGGFADKRPLPAMKESKGCKIEAVMVRDLERAKKLAEKPDETTYTFEKLPKESHGGAGVNELKAFLDCLMNNKKPFVDGEIGKESVLVSLAAEKSIKEGRIIHI